MGYVVQNDVDGVSQVVQTVTNETQHVPDAPQSSGVNPAIVSATQEGNQGTNDTTDATRKHGKDTEDTSEELDENDKKHGKNMDGVGTNLSGDGSGKGGSALGGGGGSPMGGGGSPAGGGAPSGGSAPPPMPQMPSGGGSPSGGGMSIPKDALGKLVSNYNPAKAAAASRDAAMSAAADPNGVNKDKIDAKDVEMKKTGLGSLSKSQMDKVIEKALDLNGISKDPKVRSQWHELLMFQAKHESSYIPDAVNTSDSNAHGARAADGNPFNCSRGIWQCIPTTFAAHHVSGTSANIYDPVASGAAAVNYIMDRYHVSPNGGSSLQAFYANRMKGGYTGY